MYYRYNGLSDLDYIVTPYGYFKNLNIFLIRHGESISNELRSKYKSEGKILDEDKQIEDAVIKLSNNGEQQAIQIGNMINEYIKSNYIKEDECLILVSPYERARQTFEIANSVLKFNEKSDNIYVLNTLREQFYGAFHMISREVKIREYDKIYKECQKNSISYFKPQFLGESPADVSNRVWRAIDFIKEKTENTKIKNIFIFAHSNINKCILMNILNLPPEFYDDFEIQKNNSIINIKNGKLNIDNKKNI